MNALEAYTDLLMGTLAIQNANAVAITGGTINGLTSLGSQSVTANPGPISVFATPTGVAQFYAESVGTSNVSMGTNNSGSPFGGCPSGGTFIGSGLALPLYIISNQTWLVKFDYITTTFNGNDVNHNIEIWSSVANHYLKFNQNGIQYSFGSSAGISPAGDYLAINRFSGTWANLATFYSDRFDVAGNILCRDLNLMQTGISEGGQVNFKPGTWYASDWIIDHYENKLRFFTSAGFIAAMFDGKTLGTGSFRIQYTTDATAEATGALVIDGGLSVAGQTRSVGSMWMGSLTNQSLNENLRCLSLGAQYYGLAKNAVNIDQYKFRLYDDSVGFYGMTVSYDSTSGAIEYMSDGTNIGPSPRHRFHCGLTYTSAFIIAGDHIAVRTGNPIYIRRQNDYSDTAGDVRWVSNANYSARLQTFVSGSWVDMGYWEVTP